MADMSNRLPFQRSRPAVASASQLCAEAHRLGGAPSGTGTRMGAKRCHWCGAVRCGAVRCGAVRCGAVWCGVVWCSVVRGWCGCCAGDVRCGEVRCDAARRGALGYGAVRYGAMLCGVVRYGMVQRSAVRYGAVCGGAVKCGAGWDRTVRENAVGLLCLSTKAPMVTMARIVASAAPIRIAACQ